jgi:hypothetical protein
LGSGLAKEECGWAGIGELVGVRKDRERREGEERNREEERKRRGEEE